MRNIDSLEKMGIYISISSSRNLGCFLRTRPKSGALGFSRSRGGYLVRGAARSEGVAEKERVGG